MGIFVLIVVFPEFVLLLLSYYFGYPGFNLNSKVLILYVIPIAGSFLPFVYTKKLTRDLKKKEVWTYVTIVGLSMVSLFFNSTILMLWKFETGFYWILPLFVAEPAVALYFISFTRKLKRSSE